MPLFLCPTITVTSSVTSSVTTVQDLLNILKDIAADDLAQPWDNVGLLIGSPQNRLTSILLALDPIADLIVQAQDLGADLIITHHPAIFHPLKSLRTDQPVGNFIASALQAGINVIGCHTNLDSTNGGVSDVLARAVGLIDTAPLVAEKNSSCEKGCGLGRIGNLPQPVVAEAFVNRIYETLSPPWLLEAGRRPEQVSRVAVCGGSCSDFSETALMAGADVFITAEIKHDIARWAEDAGLWIIDGGHFATENPAIPALGALLTEKMQRLNMKASINIAQQEPPLKLVTNRGVV